MQGQTTDIILLKGEDFIPFRGVSSLLLHFSSTQIVGVVKKGKSYLFSQEIEKSHHEPLIPSAVQRPVDLRLLLPKASFARFVSTSLFSLKKN